jgi:penicillin-binding protein 2
MPAAGAIGCDASRLIKRERDEKEMKQTHAAAAPRLFALLVTALALSLGNAAYAQTRRASTTKKTKPKATSTKKAVVAKRSSAKKPTSKKKLASTKKKTKAKSARTQTARARSAAARRRAAARLRAARARDAALRNSAAANILKDDATGEDLELRRVAIEALAGRAGTVVVMDPHTGRVYTIVNQRMALGSPVKPCSTVKMVVGLAALHEQVLGPTLDVQLARNGWGLNLTDALAHSNNPFFQVIGRQLGFERVMQYAGNFGFGEKTGVNHPGESDGFLPDASDVETGRMSSHGDGFGVTAMQLAAFTAAIANGGNLYVPRTPRTPEEAAEFQPELRRRIEMSPEDRMRILSGMIGAVNFGTGKLAYDPVGQVAGKTGTCTGASDKLGLFTSFSSINNPKLVVTVITTGSTEAGKRAAEIAGRIYRSVSGRFLKDSPIAPASAVTEISQTAIGRSN